ncbi:MAG: luciferase family protein [Pyrinomonadaceae bacterium]
MAERPKLFTIDAEMQHSCALLEQELSAWPEVTAKSMFGMTGFYHGKNIFAAIPRTKAADSPRSLLIKLSGVKDKRLKYAVGPDSAWVAFELESVNDIPEALRWLGEAYKQNSPAPKVGDPEDGKAKEKIRSES